MANITLNLPEIQAVIQQGILVREFFDPLFPRMLFRAEAGTPKEWAGNVGETQIFTADGEIEPTQEALSPTSDPSNVGYSREQWEATLRMYPKEGAMETHMVTSANAIVSLLLRNAKKQGLHAGRSLDLMCRTAIGNPATAGNTVAVGAQAATTTLRVARLNGFTRARRPDIAGASAVKYDTVSPTNRLKIQTITAGVATNTEVIGFTPDNAGDEFGPGVLTLNVAVTVSNRDIVAAENATWQWQVGAGGMQGFVNPKSIDTLGVNSVVRLSDIRGMMTRFNDTGNGTYVPKFPEGFHHMHMDPNVHAQLFADPEMQRLQTGALSVPDYYLFKSQMLGVALGFIFLNNNLCPKRSTVTGHSTGANTYSLKDPFGGETVNGSGINVGYSLAVGEGGLVEYYQRNDLYLSDAGVTGIIGDFSNLTNDGVSVTTQGVTYIMRAAMNIMMDRVTSTWKWVGSHAFRPDGIMGDPARFKRVAALRSAI